MKRLVRLIVALTVVTTVFFAFTFFTQSNVIIQFVNDTSIHDGFMHVDYVKFKEIYPGIGYTLHLYDNFEDKATIYIVTPTYRRDTQMADLIVLRNTLVLVPKIVWILIEDSFKKSERIQEFLELSQLNYVHLNIPTPALTNSSDAWLEKYKKGVYQRNQAINWLRERQDEIKNAILYFADDDNRYDIRIFEEMRTTKKVSVWPVGLVAELHYEGPICKNNTVVDFLTVFRRPFSVDMGGFAVNLQYLFNFPDVKFDAYPGNLETRFLETLNMTVSTLETKADDCKKVWVWHTKTKTTHPLVSPDALKKRVGQTYDPKILETV